MSDTKTMLQNVEDIFKATETVIIAMGDSDRMQVKDLADKVAVETGIKSKEVLNFVTYFLHNSDLAHVTRGKSGGVRKGNKPVKTDSSDS